MNVLYCGNDYITKGMFISLLSMVKKTKKEINAYILSMDLTEYNKNYTIVSNDKIEYMLKVLNKYGKVNIKLIDMTTIFLNHMKGGYGMDNSYTPYALLRLYIDEIDLPSKILYLDTDTVVANDISLLYDINIDEYEMGVVKDHMGQWFIGNMYFNSGVLLLNVDMIKKTKLFFKARELCKNKKVAFADQSALNNYKTSVLYLNRKFNEQKKYHCDTVVQHFSKTINWFPFFNISNIKPWNIDDVHTKLKLFVYDDILEEYLESKDNL